MDEGWISDKNSLIIMSHVCDIVCVCVIQRARFPLHCPYQFARLRKRFIYAWLYG